MEQEVRVITSAILAKKLLKEGYRITDLRPNRYDRKLSVFIFEYKDGMDTIIEKFKEETKVKQEKNAELVKVLL